MSNKIQSKEEIVQEAVEALETLPDKVLDDRVVAFYMRFENWFFDFLPNLMSALIIMVIGFYFARILSKYTAKLILKATKDETLSGFFKNILFVGILVLVVITALTNLGVKTTSIIAVLGTAGLAIALSLKDSLSNLAGGILIIVFRVFKKGDLVTLNSVTGNVESVNLFQTMLITPDNQLVILPNSSVVNSPIVNANVNQTRRMDLTFSVAYNSDLQKVQCILEEIFKEEEKILQDPAPLIGVDVLNASSVDFLVRFWVNAEDRIKIKLIMLQKVKMRFDAENIEIPYNKLDINVNNPLALVKGK